MLAFKLVSDQTMSMAVAVRVILEQDPMVAAASQIVDKSMLCLTAERGSAVGDARCDHVEV